MVWLSTSNSASSARQLPTPVGFEGIRGGEDRGEKFLMRHDIIKHSANSVQTLERHGGKCPITDEGDLVEVVHIYPHTLNKWSKDDLERRRLCLFWAPEKVQTWREQ